MTSAEVTRFDDLIPRWLYVVRGRRGRAAIGVAVALGVWIVLAVLNRPQDLRLAPALAIVLVAVAATSGPEGTAIAGPVIAVAYWFYAVPPVHSLRFTGVSTVVAVVAVFALVAVLTLLARRIERVVDDIRGVDADRREQTRVEAELRHRAERTVAQTEAVIALGTVLAGAHTVVGVAEAALTSIDLPTRPSSASIATVEGDHLRVLAATGAPPEFVEQLEKVELSRSPWLGRVLAGTPAYVEDRDEFAAEYPNALVLRLYRSGSWLVLPFRAEHTTGLLSMHYADAQPLRAFSMFFSLVGELLGSSLERARSEEQRRQQHQELQQSFAERDRIARTLSTSLLPPTLPRLTGFAASGWLVPASNDELSGDFYDLFAVAGGEWVAVLGDVCGKGAEAAAVTSLTRYAVRAAALDNPDPAQVARVANQALVADPSDLFCTAAIVRSVAGGEAVEVTLAGHLQVRQLIDGKVLRLGAFGAALGLATEAPRAVRCPMPSGSIVVLFSDGLVESDPDFAEDDFDAFLAASKATTAEELSCEIRERVTQLRRVHPDDIAVLVIQRSRLVSSV
ncbi:MAG: phosphoserine phosphatase RsbU/P [Actinomycetota bacterium]